MRHDEGGRSRGTASGSSTSRPGTGASSVALARSGAYVDRRRLLARHDRRGQAAASRHPESVVRAGGRDRPAVRGRRVRRRHDVVRAPQRRTTRRRRSQEMLRVTKPGGRLVICEFSHPPSAVFAALYRFYNDRVLPVVAKTVSSNAEAYDYLNESIRDWPDQRRSRAWIREAGWTDVAYRNLSFGIVALHRARKPRPDSCGSSVAAGPPGSPVGCDRDSLSVGRAARGPTEPHRPRLRGAAVAAAAGRRRGRPRARRPESASANCASSIRWPTPRAGTCTRRAASGCVRCWRSSPAGSGEGRDR